MIFEIYNDIKAQVLSAEAISICAAVRILKWLLFAPILKHKIHP